MRGRYLKREIMMIDFKNEGCVLTGIHPAIFLGSLNESTTCLVVPLTSNKNKKGYYNHIEIKPSDYNSLKRVSYTLIESIQCINKKDIKRSIGICSKEEYNNIIKSLNIFVKIK